MGKYENWFVAQLRPNGLSMALDHLHRQKIRTFAPSLLTTRMKACVQQETRKPLFPGYLFLQLDPNDPKPGAINSTRGVSRLISHEPHRPSPLPPQFVAELLARCDATGLLLPPVDLKIGERIRILSGPFAQALTTIEILTAQDRVGVLFDLMGRKVRTTLPRDQVQREEVPGTSFA